MTIIHAQCRRPVRESVANRLPRPKTLLTPAQATAMGTCTGNDRGLGPRRPGPGGREGEFPPNGTGAPRPAFPPVGTEKLRLRSLRERRPTRRRRPVDAGSTTNNPWLPMGGQRPPLIYATRGLRDYSRSTSARRLFRSPVRVGGGEWVTADGTPNPKLSAVPRLGGSLPVVGPSLQTGLPGVAAALGWCP